jgi:hypothetical protein
MSLTPYEPPTIERLDAAQDLAIQRLGEWANSADAAHRIAQTLVQTSFCPESFRGKAGEATAAILAGLEVGLQPMAALRSFDVIQGQAAPRAITLRAIVQSHGHEMELIESTSTRCKMRGRRRGANGWQTVDWTMDRAKQLGVTGKSNWKNQPQAMLVARATSELARLIASDAILGIGYSAEEIADGTSAETQVATETTGEVRPIGTRKMSRRKPATEDGAPARDEEGQIRAMWAAFGEAKGFEHDPTTGEGRAERLAFVAGVVGREIESTNDLTWDERSLVIDALKDTPDEADDHAAAVAAQDTQ